MDPPIIHNARVITPQGVLSPGQVHIDRGKIQAVYRASQPYYGTAIDAQGMYLAPGFIELHVHGGNGADFMDGTLDAFETITRFYATRGVTSLQATTTAAPLRELIPILETARAWKEKAHHVGARLLGVHVEGPFLNPEQAGAQPAPNIQNPAAADLEQLLAYQDIITQLTLAPELPGALEIIRQMSQSSILVAAGHSQAREAEVMAAVAAGLRHTIHIYSAMSSVIRDGPWRIPGLLETTLAYDELTTEMIADLRHLPPTLMRLVLKCKGLDRLCLVSDAMRGAGKSEGSTLILGGQKVTIEDGVAMLPDRTAFAGSITPLDSMVGNMTQVLGLSIEAAVQLVTINPARILAIDDRKGSIEMGKDADMVIFDDDVQVHLTLLDGQIVYQSETLS